MKPFVKQEMFGGIIWMLLSKMCKKLKSKNNKQNKTPLLNGLYIGKGCEQTFKQTCRGMKRCSAHQ